MSLSKSEKKLASKISGFKDEAVFLKFIRQQPDGEIDKICKMFPNNRFIKKYVDDRIKSEAGAEADRQVDLLSDKDYRQAAGDIDGLIAKSPLNTPFLTDLDQSRYYEPRINFFSSRPKMDDDYENDAKYLFRIINTHLTRKSSKFTKEEVEEKLKKISRKRSNKYRIQEADLRTILALHNWVLARSKTLSKSEKNDLFIAALRQLSMAMYMGGFSYFNVAGFGMIHKEYVHNYKPLIEEKISQVFKHAQLYHYLPILRNQHGGLDLLKNSANFLNRRLINAFETHSLDFKLKKLYTSDFKKALSNYLRSRPDKMVNGIHSKVLVLLYLDLLVYLACIHQMELPKMLADFIKLESIMEKNYDVALRGQAIQIRQLLYMFFQALSKREQEPVLDKKQTVEIEQDEESKDPLPFELLCKIMAACNQSIYGIRKKSSIDHYIEVKYFELYPLYRCYDALVNFIPDNEINKDIKVFTINFLKDALFFKQQAIARQKEDRIINVIQKMMDILKATYKRRVEAYRSSMIDDGEPDYTKTGEVEEAED